jgi:Mor family transcriptional regulator
MGANGGDSLPEGLPAIYQELVAVVGLEAALRLAKYLGGSHQYFPKCDRIDLALRNRRIRAEFNGCNQRELARSYGLSTRQVRDILKSVGSPHGRIPPP